ncbi:type II toxin-antitoxin system HicA family toxin [Niabella aquatica]
MEGSHYIYEKEGIRYPVPYHGAKEIGKGLQLKITKDMGAYIVPPFKFLTKHENIKHYNRKDLRPL